MLNKSTNERQKWVNGKKTNPNNTPGYVTELKTVINSSITFVFNSALNRALKMLCVVLKMLVCLYVDSF